MFTTYEMTRAFVAERQETLRHEAREHHQGRTGRRGRRSTTTRRTAPEAAPVELPTRPATGGEDRLAA